MLKIDVLTLFPELFEPFFRTSMIGKAREKSLADLKAINFREYSQSKHGTVDDTPYGGGGGMILKPEPLFAAVEDQVVGETERPHVVLMTPQGSRYDQKKAENFSTKSHLILICGHYEGYDERIREHLVDEEISVGDFVLTGGEIPAMTVIDSVVRLLPGALGNEQSAVTDSFSTGWLEYPHYTRPSEFRGWAVPDVLLSGHHAQIDQWRRKQSLLRTWERRPDLIDPDSLSKEEKQWIADHQASVVETLD